MTLDASQLDVDVGDPVEPQQVVIPYVPRKHLLPIHNSTKRFKFVTMHRRAGKTVGIINELIKRALENTRSSPPPRYAYIGPSFAQAKDLVWGYLKQYTAPIPGIKFSEGDLNCVLPNLAKISLYGGAGAYERMRGLYFDGAALDEFPLLNPSAWSSVVRPCLADYRGWAMVSGTSNGDDHFHAIKKKAERDPEKWDTFVIPVTETDALDPEEVKEMTEDMSAAEYAREMLCDFNAPIEGAYYAEIMNELRLLGRMTSVPWQPDQPVFTWWDLGIDDECFIWLVQRVGQSLHIIDCIHNTGQGLEYYATQLKNRQNYVFGGHVLPHDIKAREMSTGKTRYDTLNNFLENIIVCPMVSVEDGINALRATLRMCWFDQTRCEAGIQALINYSKGATGRPIHNWASHAADAARIGAVALNMTLGSLSGRSSNVIPMNGPLRRRIRRVRI
jgi:phage terminase large subunit